MVRRSESYSSEEVKCPFIDRFVHVVKYFGFGNDTEQRGGVWYVPAG